MRWAVVVLACIAWGCGASESPPTAFAGAVHAAGAEQAPIGQSEGRWHHFYAFTEARDAIIRGDLPQTRALLERFAEGDVGEDYPGDWAVFFEEIRDEASRARFVKGRLELARIVSAIGARCGECHRSNAKRGPQRIPLAELERRAQGRTGGMPASGDHRWAVDQLWLGMTIPNHQAWVAGARALIESPLHAPPPAPLEEAPEQADAAVAPVPAAAAKGAEPARPVVQVLPDGALAQVEAAERARAERLHELARVGQALHREGHPLPMARAYADLIARCAGCH